MVKKLLDDEKDDEALSIAIKHPPVIKWKDELHFNYTLMHWAVYNNCSKFLSKLFEEEEVNFLIVDKYVYTFFNSRKL